MWLIVSGRVGKWARVGNGTVVTCPIAEITNILGSEIKVNADKESSKINFGFLAHTFHTHSESDLELVSGRLLIKHYLLCSKYRTWAKSIIA